MFSWSQLLEVLEVLPIVFTCLMRTLNFPVFVLLIKIHVINVVVISISLSGLSVVTYGIIHSHSVILISLEAPVAIGKGDNTFLNSFNAPPLKVLNFLIFL